MSLCSDASPAQRPQPDICLALWALFLVVLFTLGGCMSMAPSYERPPLPVAAAYPIHLGHTASCPASPK